MSMIEFEHIVDEYSVQSRRRARYLDVVLGYLSRLKEQGYPVVDPKIFDNYVSFKFLEYNIKMLIDISVTKQYGQAKWLNISKDSNGKIISDCVLIYQIDKDGKINDGENVYDLAFKANRFLINGMILFVKKLEEKRCIENPG